MAKSDLKTINQTHFRVKAHYDIDNERALRSLWIEIPDYCHLRCPYCFADTERGCPHIPEDHLEIDEYMRLLGDFKASGGEFLGIPGNGEPFHPKNRKMVLAILRHASQLKLRTTVFTTGDAMFWKLNSGLSYATSVSNEPDFELMDQLHELDAVYLIKCNSLKAKVQDALVGQKGYTAARGQAIDWLINKYHLNKDGHLGIVTSIMPENQDEIPDLFRYAERHNLIFDCDTILPRGRGDHFLHRGGKTELRDQDYRAIYRGLEKISPEKLCTGGSYVGVACDRVKHHLYIDIKGNAYTCIGCVGRAEQEQLTLGNIRAQSLENIWSSAIRVQLRENLGDIVYGPCSYCQNFQNTCWSCLGRSVERFEFREGRLLVHTKGCFNHYPDWTKWIDQCIQLVRKRIASIPESVKSNFRECLTEDGLELFWRRSPHLISPDMIDKCFPEVRKDIRFTDMNFPTRKVWDLVDTEPPTSPSPGQKSNDDLYWEDLQSLLQRILLTSLKLISETYDKPFEPSESEWSQAVGMTQFTNLMFYLPHKRRYIYRTVAQNSLDDRILERPEYRTFVHDNSLAAEKLERKLQIRNRTVRLWQRWAEPFESNAKAPILRHIKNLSRELEGERVDTYELTLCDSLYADPWTRSGIDGEIRFHDQSILAIHPLLNIPIVRDKIARMGQLVEELASDDERWKEVCGGMSDYSFLHAAKERKRDFAALEKFYHKLAEEGFYPTELDNIPQTQRKEMEIQLRQTLKDILADNLVMFPDDAESDWYGGNIRERIAKIDWANFYDVVGGERRQENKRSQKLPDVLDCDTIDRSIVAQRTYNPLLLQFLRLFVDNKGALTDDWPKALNYFIWLGFFREHLDVRSYFVHHSPNLRRHFDVLVDFPVGDQLTDSTPSGIIICSTTRLPLKARRDYQAVFNQVMDPLEELVQAELLKAEFGHWISETERSEAEVAARKMALGHYGHTLKNRVQGLLSNLEQEGGSTHQIVTTQALLDLAIILELNVVDSMEEINIMGSKKKARFLASQKDGSWDILKEFHDSWVSGWLSGEVQINFGEQKEQRNKAILHPKLNIGIQSCLLGFPEGRDFRLSHAIYRQLFYELFTNVTRYSHMIKSGVDENKPIFDYRVWLERQILSDEPVPRQLFVITNQVAVRKVRPADIERGLATPGQAFVEAKQWQDNVFPETVDPETGHLRWVKWPDGRKFDGPGMAMDLLRRLKVGELYYQTWKQKDGARMFSTGIWLDGLEISEP